MQVYAHAEGEQIYHSLIKKKKIYNLQKNKYFTMLPLLLWQI